MYLEKKRMQFTLIDKLYICERTHTLTHIWTSAVHSSRRHFSQYNWHSLYYFRKTHIVFVWMVLPGIVQYERLISLDALTFSCFHITFHLFNLNNLVKEAGVYHYSHFIDVWTKTQNYFLFLNLSSFLWDDLQCLRTQALVWARSRVQTWFCLLSKLFNFFPWFPSILENNAVRWSFVKIKAMYLKQAQALCAVSTYQMIVAVIIKVAIFCELYYFLKIMSSANTWQRVRDLIQQ